MLAWFPCVSQTGSMPTARNASATAALASLWTVTLIVCCSWLFWFITIPGLCLGLLYSQSVEHVSCTQVNRQSATCKSQVLCCVF